MPLIKFTFELRIAICVPKKVFRFPCLNLVPFESNISVNHSSACLSVSLSVSFFSAC